MKKRHGTYTIEPREAYALQLRQIRAKMERLEEMVGDVIHEGLPETIGWAEVGEVKRMNCILAEAVEVGL